MKQQNFSLWKPNGLERYSAYDVALKSSEGFIALKADAEYMRELMFSGYEDAMKEIYALQGEDQDEA